MSPLPTPGGDNNVWGTILNSYLLVAHQADGTQNAEDVVNVPTAPITSTDVQAAINELASITATPGFYPTTTVSADYNALDSDQVIFLDSSAGTRTVFLPTPVGRTGKVYTIRKIDNTTNDARVNVAAGTPLIDGIDFANNRYVLKVQWEAITLVSDGTNWQRLDQWSQNVAGGNPANVQTSQAWVSTNYGNDDYTGRQPWAAKKTVQAAVDTGAAYIYVDNGTYTETVEMNSNQTIIGMGPGLINSGVIIRAPAADADTLIMGNQSEVRNLSIQGFATPADWTGRAVVVEAGTGFVRMYNCAVGNVTWPFSAYGFSGAPDPVTGGTGIFIRDAEQCLFQDVIIARVRTGIDIGDTGVGAANLWFTQISLQACWKEVVIGGFTGSHHFQDIKSSIAGFTCARQYGHAWDIATINSQFINCDITETNTSSVRVWNGDDDLLGYGNTFINWAVAPATKLIVDGDRNKFLSLRTLNDIYLNGNFNEIDGLGYVGGWVVIEGYRNRLRRFWNDGNATDQIKVTDIGAGTVIDDECVQEAPPAWGYGFRKGQFVRNTNFATGEPEGWSCSTQALGNPEAEAGDWIEVPSGGAAIIAGAAKLPMSLTMTATGTIS